MAKKIEPKKPISLLDLKEALRKEEPEPESAVPVEIPESRQVSAPGRKKSNKEKNHRLTVDFPHSMFAKMRDEADEEGITIRAFLLGVVKAHFAAKS